jgi:hypothetical protein
MESGRQGIFGIGFGARPTGIPYPLRGPSRKNTGTMSAGTMCFANAAPTEKQIVFRAKIGQNAQINWLEIH